MDQRSKKIHRSGSFFHSLFHHERISELCPVFYHVPPYLREANGCYLNQEYLRAAQLYLAIANSSKRDGQKRTARMFFLAARSYLLAGEAELANCQFFHCLEFLLTQNRYDEISRYSRCFINLLDTMNYTNKTDIILDWLRNRQISGINLAIQNEMIPQDVRKKLPVECPYCGGIISEKEVELIGEDFSECGYCGMKIDL